jgi:hypothetical protein
MQQIFFYTGILFFLFEVGKIFPGSINQSIALSQELPVLLKAIELLQRNSV